MLVKIDRLRRNFLWAGWRWLILKKCLISWGTVCLHKEHGGMEVLNLNQMNVALLFKWVWNYFQADYFGL
jgi:hypothetical protein